MHRCAALVILMGTFSAVAEAQTSLGTPLREQAVTFGTQQVTIRARPPAIGHGVKAPLALHYTDLERRAQLGDGAAAETLYAMTSMCTTAYTDRADLEKAITLLRTERKLLLPGASKAQVVAGDAPTETIVAAALQDPFDMCNGLTAEQRTSAERWKRVAIDLHHPLVVAAELSRTTDPTVREELLEIMWNSGESQALLAQAELLADRARSPSGTKADLIAAYARQFAAARIAEVWTAIKPPGLIRQRMLRQLEDDLSTLGRQLTEEDRALAVSQAAALVRDNLRCCTPL